jgi:iron(III) transport system permease protein
LFIAIALIGIFNRPWLGILYGTSAMVVLACTLRYCALAWGSLRGALQNVDRELTDAARVEGARGLALFWHVQCPQVAPYAAFAWYIIYLLCLWEVETLVLLLPPGGETIAVRVFNMLHYGHIGQVNALCLVLLAVALVPLVFVFRPHKTRVSTHEASGLTRGA